MVSILSLWARLEVYEDHRSSIVVQSLKCLKSWTKNPCRAMCDVSVQKVIVPAFYLFVLFALLAAGGDKKARV